MKLVSAFQKGVGTATPGLDLNQWPSERILGPGGFGLVSSWYRRIDDKCIAVKTTVNERHNLRRERLLMSAVGRAGPHIVRLVGGTSKQTNSQRYIQSCSAGTLQELIRARIRL